MDDTTDQLAALQADERVNLSSGYLDFVGLDEVRRHQRGERVGKPRKVREQTKQRKKVFPPQQLEDMAYSTDPLSVIAKRCDTTKETVRAHRLRADNYS
jgi:hypothetical protein